jgi:hypothetical protein
MFYTIGESFNDFIMPRLIDLIQLVSQGTEKHSVHESTSPRGIIDVIPVYLLVELSNKYFIEENIEGFALLGEAEVHEGFLWRRSRHC